MQADLQAALKKVHILELEVPTVEKLEKLIDERGTKRGKAAYEREFAKSRADDLEPASLLGLVRDVALPKQNKRGPKPRSAKGEVTSPASDMLKLASANLGDESAEGEGVSGV